METKDFTDGVVLKGRDVPPSHCLFKIRSFSLLRQANITKCSSDTFESGGFKWRMYIYLTGCQEKPGEDHISIYLELSETTSLPLGWEVHVILNFFIFNHLQDKYFSPQDGRVKRFHAMKTKWGIIKFIDLKTFCDSLNGYLVDDTCVFGVEVFVVKSTSNMQQLSMKGEPANFHGIWAVNKFSTLLGSSYESESFGTYKWKIALYPHGDGRGSGTHISIFLRVDQSCIPSNSKLLVKFVLRVKDQLNGKHVALTADTLFAPSTVLCWGFPEFMLLTELKDPKEGFLVNDIVIIESDITLLGLVST